MKSSLKICTSFAHENTDAVSGDVLKKGFVKNFAKFTGK